MSRILLFSFLGAVLLLTAYANIRFVNPSASLEPVDVATFEVNGLLTNSASELQMIAASTPAIRAISIDEQKNVLGVTYQYQVLDEPHLIEVLSLDGKLGLSRKIFEAKAGCPVHGALAVWEKTLSALRFVD